MYSKKIMALRRIFLILLASLLCLSLFGCGKTSEPDPSPAQSNTPSPDPSPVETSDDPTPDDPASDLDEYTIVINAEDADLSNAEDVVLEPSSPPYNLGGWKADNTVTWSFDVAVEGIYSISIVYARAYTDVEVWGATHVTYADDPNPYYYEFQTESTSSSADDWSEYVTMEIGSGRFYQGAYELEMFPGTMTDTLLDEHFVNLRSVILIPLELEEIKEPQVVTNTTAPVAFEGKWYSYPMDMWVIIEGNTYTTIRINGKPGDETTYSNVCELDGDTLILYGENANYTLSFLPDGILYGEYMGHLRPQDDDELDEAPIDLSANSYLGEWYCEELGDSIILRWDYEVSHITGGTSYSVGDYEPYGNRLVLGYSSTSGGSDTIFNGGDAVYDPDAQTLTTAGTYVYERVSYGGGRKYVPKYVTYYDFFDWGSPYRSKEEVASDIIAVWLEHNEDVDPKYLDVDQLIEIIDISESEHETIFLVACEEAGIDATTYLGID